MAASITIWPVSRKINGRNRWSRISRKNMISTFVHMIFTCIYISYLTNYLFINMSIRCIYIKLTIHLSIHQALSKTGRVRSSRPGLQPLWEFHHGVALTPQEVRPQTPRRFVVAAADDQKWWFLTIGMMANSEIIGNYNQMAKHLLYGGFLKQRCPSNHPWMIYLGMISGSFYFEKHPT